MGGRVRLRSPQSADEEQHRRKSGFASLGATDTGPLRLSHAVFFGRHLPARIILPVVIQTLLTTKNVVLRLTRARTCNMLCMCTVLALPWPGYI